MKERILRTLQHLCLTEFKINLYTYDEYIYTGNSSGTFWSALYYQVEGEMAFQSEFGSVKVVPGDFYYIPVKYRYSHFTVGDKPVKFYIISFSFRESEGNYFDSKYGISKITAFDSRSVHERFNEIFENFIKDDAHKLLAVSEFYRFFSDILPYLQEQQPFMLHPAVQKAMDYINEHLTENFTIKDLADHCFISESRLYHLFSEQLHISPINYRNHMRVKASFTLLTTTNLSVDEIAEKMNFASATHYRYAFRKTTGSTPRKYRKIFKQCH